MTEIKWEEPSAAGGGPGSAKYAGLLNEIRKRPGQWGCIGRHHQGLAAQIKRGLVSGADQGEFEAVTRNQKDNKADIYVRFIGNGAE